MRGRPGTQVALPKLSGDRLSPQQRQILLLADEGLSVSDIARQIGTSVGAVKSQVHKIRDKAAQLTSGPQPAPLLTVPIEGRREAVSGAEELRRVFDDHGRMAHLFSRGAGGPAVPDSVLADESPEAWHRRGRLIRVLASAGERDRAIVRVTSGEKLAPTVVRQGKVLYRAPGWGGEEELFVAVPRSSLAALQSTATA